MTIKPAVKKTTTTITRSTKVTIEEALVADLIRTHLNAPPAAAVTFDCGYECLREIVVTWSETEESE